MEVRKFYQTATKYLFSKLSCKSGPERPCDTASSAMEGQRVQAIVRIAKRMPQVISQEEINLLSTDRRMHVLSDTRDPRELVPRGWFR